MSSEPKSILYLRFDTFGDIVIFASALAELQAAWPQARHTLVVRPGYETLAPLFPSSLHWHVVAINPFHESPASAAPALSAAIPGLEVLAPDLIVAPSRDRTWLEAAIAARFPGARRVALGPHRSDRFFGTGLKLGLSVDAKAAFPETAASDDDATDWENNHLLADHLLERKTGRAVPRLTVPPSAAEEAGRILAQARLAPRAFAAVFPAGMANVAIKIWPAERFAEVVAGLQRKQKLPSLLLAHASEAETVERVRAEVARLGGTPPAFWLGRDGQFPLLAGLFEQARLYIGNDTGAMHLAAAVGRPALAVFGGGHWPRFRPIGARTAAVVQPLPCFGCGWDCPFGDAPCVKAIAVADVQAALADLLCEGAEGDNRIVATKGLPSAALDLIARMAPNYRALRRSQGERQRKIEELKHEADGKEIEIARLKQTCDERLQLLQSQRGEMEGKEAEIARLKQACDERLRLLETQNEALREAGAQANLLRENLAAQEKLIATLRSVESGRLAIEALQREADGKEAEIARLKQICDERLQLAERLTQDLRQTEAQANRLELATAALEREKARLEELLAALPSDAREWAGKFAEKEAAVRGFAASAALHERTIAELRVSLQNYTDGYASLEQTKHFGRLLAEKEAVIQSLNQACIDRQKLIERLAAAATTPTEKIHRFWSMAAARVKDKISKPLQKSIFRSVVEKYWMQIGVLQHYPPRIVAWDRLPSRRLPAPRLPRIGIVTPSYNHAAFLEGTLRSVLNQNYPKLVYGVQDGNSKDGSQEIIARHADRLAFWESAKDRGQADAIGKGFAKLAPRLGPEDVMAWINSDDLIAPGALRYVAEYFATHPEVDAVYGHRIIIDDADAEIGRWIMPRHDPRALEWVDYVPQETLYWRKRAWDLVGGLDPSFQFALDWDLLARFTQAKLRLVRLPYFLGCFRVHRAQKTSRHIDSVGAQEMARVRARFHGEERPGEWKTIHGWTERIRLRGALTARLHAFGLRW